VKQIQLEDTIMTDEELRISCESQAESIRELRTTAETQKRLAVDAMAKALESAAISKKIAAAAQVTAALELSANTSRNLDRQEQDTAELKQMIGILIRDNQADRVRFGRLEGQN
jgi:hypothetical protein